MKTKTRIRGIYKPQMRRPTFETEGCGFGKPATMRPGLYSIYDYHNGLMDKVTVFMADGSQFILESSLVANDNTDLRRQLAISKKTFINTKLANVDDFAPMCTTDEHGTLNKAQEQLKESRDRTLRRVNADWEYRKHQSFLSWDSIANTLKIDPEISLVMSYTREDFEANQNIIFCKELACVFVYGLENIPSHNPHPFYTGIDVGPFLEAASSQFGQSINISILDSSGSTSQKSFYVPIVGKEVKINTVFDQTVHESGVYITHLKVAPNGTMVRDESETRFYTIDDALKDGLIFLSKEEAVTGGTREARWKHHQAKEEFERKMRMDEEEWSRKREEFDRKQKAHEADMERQRILHEQKLEAERVKMERETKAHLEELERRAKQAEFERIEREESDKYDKQKKERENANEKGSFFRKAITEFLKMIPAMLAAATAVIIWMAKKAATAV